MTPEQKAEWEAWKEIVRQWPGDINDPKFNGVVEAIRQWGERLAVLRVRFPAASSEKR